LYAAAGLVWAGFVDPFTDYLLPDPSLSTFVDIIKDCLFVLVSAGLIYLLMRRMVASLERTTAALERNLDELRATSAALAIAEDQLKDTLARAGEATWEWWESDGSIHLSPNIRTLVGLDDVPLELSFDEMLETIHPEDRARVTTLRDDLFHGRVDRYELVFRARRTGGGWRWLMSNGGFDRRGGKGQHRAIGTLRDVSELHQRDEDLRAANAALHALIVVNRKTVEAKSRDELLNSVCETLAKELPLQAVWIGEAVHDATRSVRRQAWAGPMADYTAEIKVTWDESPTGQGLVGRTIRTGAVQTSNDIEQDPRLRPWIEMYRKLGITSSAAIPIPVGGSVWGVLVVHGIRPSALGERERDVLLNLGEDIGHALASFAAVDSARASESARVSTLQELQEANVNSVRALAATVEARDPYTAGHEMRVAHLAVRIGKRIGLTPHQLDGLLLGGNLHDIGKIGVPAEFLAKPGRLLKAEMDVVREHPRIGREIVRQIKFPWPIAEIIGQHHERIDGSGYPDGIKGDQICIEARVLAVADVVEAMLSHRPYRPGLKLDQAVEELRSGRGTKYWPEAVDACLAMIAAPGFTVLDVSGGLDRMPSIANYAY
jgi:putative nucleotidyltransferase with HDIG domain